MRKSTATVVSTGFFVVAPGTVLGVIPWLITCWQFGRPLPGWAAVRPFGAILITVGLAPLISAFVEFIKAGGTPMPGAPTERLVVSGLHRYVRNPIYVVLLLVVIGQALLFGNARLLGYAAVLWAFFAAFVRGYEEPTLSRQFGSEYDAYRREVPGWFPRLRPWDPDSSATNNEPD